MNTNNSHATISIIIHVKKEILDKETLDEVTVFEFPPDDDSGDNIAFALLPKEKAVDCIAQAAFAAYKNCCLETSFITWGSLSYPEKQGWREAVMSVLENCGYMYGMAIPEPDLIEELSSGKDFPEI